ncbi:MoaD/ThiS family protein [Rathayibacter soli]|uniref:MoaD/ThiS family protein n=1 Tax=Rathayibacter soli TaxID=3144168 RepID=UPI0027E47309|nr:MoaD/ThiS family protein [Glaciibacter superstes]
MNVAVRYFAAAAEASGCEEEHVELTDGATVGELATLLVERYGEPMGAVLKSGSFLVDGVVRRDQQHPLSATVDILPPFAGG